MPADRAACTPAVESSITTHAPGAAPSRSAALRKMSGAGLPRATSSTHTYAPNQRSKPNTSIIASTFSRGAEVATICFQPRSCSRSTISIDAWIGWTCWRIPSR